MSDDAKLSVRVHGPRVTEATAREVGDRMADLLHDMAESLHPGADLRWKVGRVDFCCDGCDRRQPFDADRTGWAHRGGDDFCPRCEARGHAHPR